MAENDPTVTPYVPWGLHPLPQYVIDEIENRVSDYGMSPTKSPLSGPHRGPRTAWIRVCSNGKGKDGEKVRDGFVLGGTHGFDDSHGFNSEKNIVIGYDVNGSPHKISADSATIRTAANMSVKVPDFPHRPPPNLNSIECELNGSTNSSFPGLCRKVRINFRCNSLAQLNYLIPYFFTPRITVLVEWGWSSYNPASLVDLTDVANMRDMFANPKNIYDRIKLSSCNYDAAIGYVTDFGYTLNQDGGYDCFTSITNANFLLEGQTIHNQISKGEEGGKPEQKKTFKEFISNDLENLKDSNVEASLKALNIDVTGRVFHAKKNDGRGKANADRMWISMGLMADIVNKFYSSVLLDDSGGATYSEDPATAELNLDASSRVQIALNRLDINSSRICGHPALKSTNPDVLFPNKFAPRFTLTKRDVDGFIPNRTDITSREIMGSTYETLFPNVVSVLRKYEFDKTYDDLSAIINSGGNSFPVYEDFYEKSFGRLDAGYWGYLKDVYVSVDLIKRLVENQDTVMRFLEALLQNISQAMCNIAQLKLSASDYSNSVYSVTDANLSYVTNANEADALKKISIGSIGSAFLRSAQFDVKLNAEMANQMVFQSANPNRTTPPPPGFAALDNDPKKRDGSERFSEGDRLFDRALIPQSVPSNKNPGGAEDKGRGESSESKTADDKPRKKREFEPPKCGDVFFTYEKNAAVFILSETESEFINYLITGLDDPKAVYLNNAIMPGTTFNMEILGLSGITYLSQFALEHVPDTYNSSNAIWQVSDIKHVVDNKIWTTSITAQVRPLSYISTRT